MASERLEFDVLARDRASATFNKISQSTAALESRFTRLSRAATGIATTLVGAQIGKSVLDAADKFELSRSRLETITKNIGANFDGLSKQVSQADDQMAKFGFTSADAEGSLASLESVTRDPIKAFKDLALAADIARGRNIGLSEATLILQRVETGHIAQLAKLGIATKDAAGHTLTQAQALQMLTDLYGGAASHFAGTFAGKQAAVAAAMKNSAAQIGVALLPAAVDLANVLQHDVLPPIEATAKFLDRNRKVIEPLAKAILITAAGWKAYTLATSAAAAVTKIMGGNAAATAVALRAEAAAAATAGASGSAGVAIGAGMAANLGTGALIASRAINAVKYAPAAGVGAVADLGPISKPLQQRLNAQQALIGNPAALKELQAALIKDRDLAGPALASLVGKLQQATTAVKGLGSAEATLGAVVHRTADQIEASAKHAFDLRSAQDSLRQAMHNAAQIAIDNGKALAGNSDAALANRDALRNQVAQIFAVIDAMKARNADPGRLSAMIDILTQAVEQNAIKLYGDKTAVDALLTSLGLLPGAVNAATSAMGAYAAAQVAADKALDPKRLAALSKVDATSKASAKKIADSFTSGYTPVVSKAAEKAAKAVSDSMQRATDKVQNDLQTMRDAINQTRSTIAGFAGFDPSGTDTLGASGANDDFTAQKRVKAAALEQFAKLYVRLSKTGLNPDDLHEFVGLGPAAIPAMQTLLASGRSGIRAENAVDRRINAAAGQVAIRDATSQNLGLLHRDLQKLPLAQAKALAGELRKMGLAVNLREIDKRNGKLIVSLT